MKYLSVCSGIEAATVAWHPLGWEPLAFSEIDKFPRAVLQHHYPDIPLHGDFTTIGDEYGRPDILVGGTPCQSFSIAGLRKGMDDERGNLALEYLKLAQRLRAKWLVWENVPGVLSSNGGRDFGSFLGGLEKLGYGFAYRILDAQYIGVAQRRRRVFVIGYLGDWRPPAAVLFESDSLSWNPPPSREKRESVTALTANGVGTCGADANQGQGGHLVPFKTTGAGFWQEGLGTLRAREQDSHENLICSAQSGTITGNHGEQTGQDLVADNVVGFQSRASASQSMNPSEITPSLDVGKAGGMAVCFTQNDGGRDSSNEISPTIRSGGDGGTPTLAVAFEPGIAKRDGVESRFSEEVCPTLRSNMGDNQPAIQTEMQVRRLTPVECERLQGFPDNYTQIPWRNKSAAKCPDGPRYKALGNSMAVPVMRWVGERIKMVSGIGK